MHLRRHKLSKHHSRRMFSKHADRTHGKNLPKTRHAVMRGGIRL